MSEVKNQTALACNIETGVCGEQPAELEAISLNQQPSVKILYYTDPICSTCWAIEPLLKQFKAEYGAYFTMEYRMGGLLEKWNGFADRANGISKPEDVAHHWDEVGQLTRMSIDGDVWLEDPLMSSYPPSIAFKAAQFQDKEKAVVFLRKLRELLFLEKKNITREEHIARAAKEAGLDAGLLLKDFHSDEAKNAFYAEMQEGRSLGVRGFPTFILLDESGKGFRMSGMVPYEQYAGALEKVVGKNVEPKKVQYAVVDALKQYDLLAEPELEALTKLTGSKLQHELQKLEQENLVVRAPQKHSMFWKLK